MHAIRRLFNGNYTPSKDENLITFTKDWQTNIQGSLLPGEDVSIVYDAERLLGREEQNGKRAWNIFVEVKYDDGDEVHSTKLEGPDENSMMRTKLTIRPKATTFIVWFKHWGNENGFSYDSNYGKNYLIPFNQIILTSTWDDYVTGDLHPGGKFQVVYDSSRLPWRDRGFLGLGRAWDIFAHAQFKDDGPVVKQVLKGPESDDARMKTAYDIPHDAEKLIMWFYSSGPKSGTHYDSNSNVNYHFALSGK